MTNQEFVTMHWERAEECPHRDGQQCCISLGGFGFTRKTVPDTVHGYATSPRMAWFEAAEYTRERLEQVRRVESDLSYMSRRFADPFDDGWGDEGPPPNWEPERYEDFISEWIYDPRTGDGDVREFIKDSYCAASIIQRLEDIRDDLKRGMK